MESKDKKPKKMRGGITGQGFDVRGQPSPEAKRNGMRRKRDLQYWINRFSKLSVRDFQKLGEKFRGKRSSGDLTMEQFIAYKYVAKCSTDYRVVFDRLDRTRGKAVQKVESKVTTKNQSLEFKILDATEPNTETRPGLPGDSDSPL